MKLYNLVPEDSSVNDWLFWYEDGAGYVRPRPLYADLVCTSCGKLDELAALERGIDRDITVRSRNDFIELSDGLIAISSRAKDAFQEEGVKGLSFLGLSDEGHSVLWPEVRVRTDINTAGFQFVEPKCDKCARYREVCVGPMVRSLEVPGDPAVVFSSEVWNEDTRGRVLWLFAQAPVANALERRGLKGLDPIPAR